jgi:hypothetical protein
MRRKALLAARMAMAYCAIATILATICFLRGDFLLYAINCLLFIVNAVLAWVNYRLVNKLEGK